MIVFENKGLRVLQFTCEDVSHDLDVSTKKYSEIILLMLI